MRDSLQTKEKSSVVPMGCSLQTEAREAAEGYQEGQENSCEVVGTDKRNRGNHDGRTAQEEKREARGYVLKCLGEILLTGFPNNTYIFLLLFN